MLELWNATTGAPYGGTTGANLTLTLQNSTFQPETVTLVGPHGNHYYADNVAMLSQPGTWRIDAVVTRADLSVVRATFYARIQRPGG